MLFGLLKTRGCHVVGDLHHFDGVPLRVEHQRIGRDDPHRLAVLRDTLVFALVEFAASEFLPELPIRDAGGILRLAKHPVVLASQFG